MEKHNIVPGTQPRAGVGVDGQELGLAAPSGDSGRPTSETGGSLRARAAELVDEYELPVTRDNLVARIRAHPLLSCGVALGAGVLIGSAIGGGRADHDVDYDEPDHARLASRLRTQPRHGEDDESGLRAQLGRAVVSGIVTLLTNEVRSRVAGRDR